MFSLVDSFQHLSHGFIVADDVETLHNAGPQPPRMCPPESGWWQ